MRRALLVVVSVLFVGVSGSAQKAEPPAVAPSRITTPKQEFGHDFGDDYFLANYQQISAYWKKLEKESPRIKLREMGKTAEGRTQLMAIVTSPENQQHLARYKEIAARLAHARGADGDVMTDDQARALAREGKTIVWIDGGLHATEVLGAQQLGEMVYQFVSRTDDETTRILNDCIILFVHANPDGNDLTADWYMRNPVPEQRSMTGLPKLYQKYIGHDNNRDFFGSTQAETENMNRVLYREWFPEIVYNHHQSGPAGTILWSPPLRDPFNYNQDPLLVLGIQTVGLALHTRLAAEGKPGATSRNGGPYDGWWNGGLRNTAAFHNMIAILTEMIGNPTPQRVPLVIDRQVPSSDLEYPVPPTTGDDLWHFRQSIDYSTSTNRGVLDLASRMRENFLFNIYRMGKNSIERGMKDSWTPRPHRIASIVAENPAAGAGRGRNAAADSALWAQLHRPEDRDPRAFVISSAQRDFLTATKFINALLETGITVERATRAFTTGGQTYPAGSFVVNANQAFRPHVIDMFEPQDHPDNFAYPGAPPTRPYDNAGWTLAFQMGVEFDRLFDSVADPALRVVTDWNVAPSPGVVPASSAGGFLLSHDVVDSFRALNKLAGHQMGELTSAVTAGGTTFPVGTFWVDAASAATLADLAQNIGISATAVATKPSAMTPMKAPRVGLWDQYGGSMAAGWTRWILEQFDFPFDRVFAPELDAGNLNAKYDVLIFVNGAIPAAPSTGSGQAPSTGSGQAPSTGPGQALPLPAEFAGQQGAMSMDVTMPALKQFVEHGGTIIAIGSSATNLGGYLGLPMTNHLVENGAPIPQTKFYTPGSVLRARLDTASPFAFGMREHTDVFFDNSPVWTIGADAAARNVKAIAWFDSKTPLRSGWAWGQAYLENGVIGIDAKVGAGRVLLYGPEILQRAQPHGTFKFLFNGIWTR